MEPVLKLPRLETFPLDLFKQYYFVLFSYIYLIISCQYFGVGLGLGIGLVSFPGLLSILDSIGTGREKMLYRKSPGTGLGENLVLKKVPEPVSVRFLGLVTHCLL